ncbi:MAG: SAM-dependent methyltransferase [Caulobacterales bacterium]|nr:SAM-dependent methyltransferase [Caulobacterales bacterium]
MSETAGAEPDGPQRDLKRRLVARVRSDGPMSVAAFMAEALHDPRAGYYATKDPIGAGGDFITAPEISQMFGELVGLWCVQSWMDLGEPQRLRLIELGPGRGVMMADALRAASLSTPFMQACEVTFVEASPALASAQAERLARAPAPIFYAPTLETAPPGPAIILGNEFLDCLPVRQFVRVEGAWRERMVGLDPAHPGRLAFLAAPAPLAAADLRLLPAPLRDAPDGTLIEARPTVEALTETLAGRAAPFRALFIDYGPADSEAGDTLQAVRVHEKADPLAAPGEADLTARVDFAALAGMARTAGLRADGPVEQGAWLLGLGLEQRAAALSGARPEAKRSLAEQLHRLTDPSQMGRLFKVICLSSQGLPPPAGFPPAD